MNDFQNFRDGFKPNIKRVHQTIIKPATLHVSESGVGLLTHNRCPDVLGRRGVGCTGSCRILEMLIRDIETDNKVIAS